MKAWRGKVSLPAAWTYHLGSASLRARRERDMGGNAWHVSLLGTVALRRGRTLLWRENTGERGGGGGRKRAGAAEGERRREIMLV